jgi:ferredoxin
VAERPVIDPHKCDGCGLCVGVCHRDALVIVNNIVAIIETVDCDWCTDCEAVCPTGAINCPYEIIIHKP